MNNDQGTKRSALVHRFRTLVELASTLMVIVVAIVFLGDRFRPASTASAATPARPRPTRPALPLPSEPISLEGAALLGDPKAKIGILLFSDFQCPFCRTFAVNIWPDVQKQFIDTGKVRFAFRHLPLDSIHPMAKRLGQAAECGRRLGMFWPVHDRFFGQQQDIARVDFRAVAAEIGLDADEFVGCVDNESAAAVVRTDTDFARRLGITGTPTFLLGRIEGGNSLRGTASLVGARDMKEFEQALRQVAPQ